MAASSGLPDPQPSPAALPRAFFDHVFKAAGTSLQAILLAHYGGENLCRVDGHSTAAAFAHGRHFPLIAGHVAHTKGFLPFRERVCFALLRHPVARAVSAYRHLRRQPLPSSDPAVKAAHAMTLRDFAAGTDSETAIVRDHQARHFAAMGAGAEGDSVLDGAKAALSLYHAIGVQEEFAVAVRIVCANLGLPMPAHIPFANVGEGGASDVAPQIRRAIEKVNPDDLALWEWVRHEARRMAGGKARPSPPWAAFEADDDAVVAVPAVRRLRREALGGVELLRVVVEAVEPGHLPDTPFDAGAHVRVLVLVQATAPVSELTIGLGIADVYRQSVFETNSFHLGLPIALSACERKVVEFTLTMNLAAGAYVVDVSGHRGSDEQHGLYFWHDEACKFDVANRTRPFFRGIAYLPATIACAPAPPGMQWMSPIDDARLAVRLRCVPGAAWLVAAAGDAIDVPVLVTNDSGYALSSCPPAPMMLSYHIADARGETIVFDGERTGLTAPIGSGEERGVLLRVKAPEDPGTYRVTPCLVQEGHRWFDDGDALDTQPVRLEVSAPPPRATGLAAGAAA